MPRQLKSVKCTKVDHSTKNVVYIIVATLTAGSDQLESRYIGKTVSDLTEFRKIVLQLSKDLDSKSSTVRLPDMKEKKGLMGGWKDERNRTSVDEFFQHLLKLPSEILQSKAVANFFLESSAVDEDGALKLLINKEAKKKSPRDKGKDESVASTLPSPSPAVRSSHAINSASSDISKVSYSIDAYEEIDCFTKPTTSSKPPLSSIYSEVKLVPGNNSRFMGADSYAECVETAATTTLPAIKTAEISKAKDQMNQVTSGQQQIYAFVKKPKPPQPQAVDHSSSVVTYEDSGCVAAPPQPDPELELYENSMSANSQLPVANYKQSFDVATPIAPTRTTIPVSASMPLAPNPSIPPMPLFPSPILQSLDTKDDDSPKSDDDEEEEEIQVVAICDYDATADNVLSFKKGTLAFLLLQSDSDWWCVRLGSVHGWVPAAYWRTLDIGECTNLMTKGNSPWFVGKLSRAECETRLMEHGKQQNFVVRESNKGHYALSVKCNNKIRHFPIEVTPDRKYNIGKHDFKTVNNIILYYQKNALFQDDEGQEITLGSPLVTIKH